MITTFGRVVARKSAKQRFPEQEDSLVDVDFCQAASRSNRQRTHAAVSRPLSNLSSNTWTERLERFDRIKPQLCSSTGLSDQPDLRLQRLVEVVDGALPGDLGRFWVITRCRVVMKAVIRFGVHISLVFHATRL
jgi:hypothetical protein